MSSTRMPAPLTEAALLRGVRVLIKRDLDLSRINAQLGPPPLWAREPGFPTLVHIILEQQVSLASARAAFDRLLAQATPLTPQRFLEFNDAALKRIGFSRQKAGYCRQLAESIVNGQLDLDGLAAQPDDAVRATLLKLKGVGPWTVDIYLLMALRRPDVWPQGDLALISAVQRVKQLPERPTSATLETMSQAWRPWRAVAARLFWYYYLSKEAIL